MSPLHASRIATEVVQANNPVSSVFVIVSENICTICFKIFLTFTDWNALTSGSVTCILYISLTNRVRGPYSKLQTKFFPVHLWPKRKGHKLTGKNEYGPQNWPITARVLTKRYNNIWYYPISITSRLWMFDTSQLKCLRHAFLFNSSLPDRI